MFKAILAAVAAALLSPVALAQTPDFDATGTLVFPVGPAGEQQAMANYDAMAKTIGVTPIGATHPVASQFEPVANAVFARVENNGGCEVIKPGKGEPVWDGYCSSDGTIQVCAETCFGTKNKSSPSGAVFELLGMTFADDMKSADVYASIGWTDPQGHIRVTYFRYYASKGGGGWKVDRAVNWKTGAAVQLWGQ